MQEIELVGRFLPRDRRDLQQTHVDYSQSNLFAVCVKLKLFTQKSVGRQAMDVFSRKLFLLVKRRHTHLWDIVDQHVGAATVEKST